MGPESFDRRWFWATLMLSSITIAAVVFALWELIEHRLFHFTDYARFHFLYITRGVVSSLLLAIWAAWYVLRQRRSAEEALRQSHERYRGLLEVSPGAVVLYDTALRVVEWNAAAGRLYSFAKSEVLGQLLPTVPPEKEDELRRFLEQVQGGSPVLDVETVRRNKQGATFEVQLSLLPFRESDGQSYFLEVTTDIRERVRLRQKMLEIEKLATMGQMAAGTAHHLNTPLGAMLLRVQMMQERMHHAACLTDLERLENGIKSCQQFVRRLLEFGRRPPMQKQPEDVARTLQSVLSFLAPALNAKQACVSFESGAQDGRRVLADRNQLEALFSVLLSNALDAISPGGSIAIRCSADSDGWMEIRIADSGSGISAADQQHVFEPFFTTKVSGKGTGLGLAIARNIVMEHGGTIRLESKTGQGTTAFLQLPLWKPEPHREAAHP